MLENSAESGELALKNVSDIGLQIQHTGTCIIYLYSRDGQQISIQVEDLCTIHNKKPVEVTQ